MNNNSPSPLSGSILGLLSEYKKAIDELIFVIQPLQNTQLISVVDFETKDPDCKSIQTILSHVVCSGFGYIIYIENFVGIKKPRLEKTFHQNVNNYIEELNKMFEYALNFFQNHTNLAIEEFDNSKKIKVNWGQHYDIEQLLEHAIVHILRHRRQIEFFIEKLPK
jgi:uncharacterized damage-inducible protein DinB